MGCLLTELHIYVDESGDLGFKGGGSRYFVIGAIITKNNKCVEKIPKKIRGRVLKKSKKDIPELKAHNSSKKVRMKVLEMLAKCKEPAIIWLWIDKKHTYEHIF